MGKTFGILLAVLGIWLSFELYMNGIQGAFGGALASLDGSEEQAPVSPRPVTERAGSAVEGAHAEADARRRRMLGE